MAYEGDTITAANPYNSSTGQFGIPSGSSSSLGSLGNLGPLAAGGAGLAGLFTASETPPPWEYGQIASNATAEEGQGGQLFSQGQGFVGSGAQALQMAQNGQLTPQQTAQLQLYRGGLQNTAAQTFASMGRNINQDTTGISAQADIDTKVNAMANAQIQSTIQLGLAETGTGNSLIGEGLGAENAANNALAVAGKAQVDADTAYSSALTGAFSAIGTLLGGGIGASMGGPAGAVAGASIGKAL